MGHGLTQISKEKIRFLSVFIGAPSVAKKYFSLGFAEFIGDFYAHSKITPIARSRSFSSIA